MSYVLTTLKLGEDEGKESKLPGVFLSTTGLYVASPPLLVSADRRTQRSKPQIHFKCSPGTICSTDRGTAACYQTGRAVSSFLNVNQELESCLVLG